ncbi:PolC-type DNA polymerase III [Leeuwenhoekiella sp. MAR_2009_132]|uniref:3'-5' exonuclease n=1 Tax=Leeuwenhoekiella sp. MAR_2009_132 TaxID=1392489 RepID=UPI00048E081F|nr:3'-5' exonuclease [Leeuwenhoekiella sp. MAR_2009_132]
MRIPFFDKKPDPPEFYKTYAKAFSEATPSTIEDTRFVVFDTETTGINARKDRMLSLGALEIKSNQIQLTKSLEVYVSQEIFNEEAVAIHGILRQHRNQIKISEEETVKLFLEFIGNAVLVGHHVGFDIAIINYALKRLGAPKLKNRFTDTGILFKRSVHLVNITNPDKVYSLDELCEELNISKNDRHKAMGDAFITALAFLKIQNRLRASKKITLKDILI